MEKLENDVSTRIPGIKKAKDVFKLCPACGSANLTAIDGDLICDYCEWISAPVREQILDSIFMKNPKDFGFYDFEKPMGCEG